MDIPFLTVGESRVYESLIALGESTVGNILKQSHISHSKIYDVLKRLEDKGLVSRVTKNGRQVFSPAHPSRLRAILAEEQKRVVQSQEPVENAIRQLSARLNTATSGSILQAFEGYRGVKTVVDGVLEELHKGDTVYVLGSPKEWGEKFGGYMIEWQKQRLRTGAKCWILVDKDAPSWDYDWWKKSKKQGLTITKRAVFKAPSYLIITKHSVVTIHAGVQPLALLVRHEGIASRYREFFLELWKWA